MTQTATTVGAVLIVIGVTFTHVGLRVRHAERADLIFAPGLSVEEADLARVGGRTTAVAGLATVGAGIGGLLIPAGTYKWVLLLALHSVVCLGAAAVGWWQLRTS